MKHVRFALSVYSLSAALLTSATAYAGGGGQALPVVSKPSAPAAHSKAPSSKAAAGQDDVSALLGTWEVTRVLPDLADQPHWSLRPDDPEVLYRSMTITRDKLWFVGESESCDQTSWKPLRTTWQQLFQKLGLTRNTRDVATQATPKDYDLKVVAKQPISAYPVCPKAGMSSSKLWRRGSGFMVLEAPDSLVVRLSDQVLVQLRKRAADERPHASFDCSKASSQTEHAICASFELANWDRSLAGYFQQMMEGRPKDMLEELMKEHMAWKKQRDACGSKADCIQDAIQSRLNELKQQ